MNKKDSTILFICFLIGAVGIITLKHLHVNQFVVTAWPIAIMLVYAREYYSAPQYQRGKAGDNLYYLGFLYTLVSLGVSLFAFSLSAESIEKITPIITNFGIAIASTIFGIIFRVFFNQSEEDETPTEGISKASLGLEEAVSSFREKVSTLNSELGEFSNFRIGLQQILRESSDEQRKAIAQVKASVTLFTKTLEEGREQFQVSFDSFGDTVSGLNERVSHLNSTVNDCSEAVSTSLFAIKANSESVSAGVSDLVGKINGLQVPENLLEQLLAPSIQQIETEVADFVNAASSLNAQVSNLDSAIKANSALVSTSVSDLVDRINNIQAPTDFIELILRPSIERIQIETEQIGNAIEALVNRLNNVQIPTDDLERSLQQVADAVSASANDLIEKSKSVQVNSTQAVETLLKQLETSTERTVEGQQTEDGNP